MSRKQQLLFYKALFLICTMAGTVTRTNFAAIISEIEDATGFSKVGLSLAITLHFITFAIGHLLAGYIGDRTKPKELVVAGMLMSAALNALIPVCTRPIQMIVLWALNGVVQAFLGPPMLLMVVLVVEDGFQPVSMLMNGTITWTSAGLYAIAPILISLWSWKAVFYVSALLGILAAFLFLRFCPDKAVRTAGNPEASIIRWKLIPVAFHGIVVAAALEGALKNGVTTWMPTNLEEVFHISGSLSILSGALLPLFSSIIYVLSMAVYNRLVKNPVRCAGLLFAVGVCSTALLTIFSDTHPMLSVFLFCLLNGVMNSAQFLLLNVVPTFFQEEGLVSTVSGALFASSYFGSGIFTFYIGSAVGQTGWTGMAGIWCGVAIVGAILCRLSAYGGWGDYKRSNE